MIYIGIYLKFAPFPPHLFAPFALFALFALHVWGSKYITSNLVEIWEFDLVGRRSPSSFPPFWTINASSSWRRLAAPFGPYAAQLAAIRAEAAEPATISSSSAPEGGFLCQMIFNIWALQEGPHLRHIFIWKILFGKGFQFGFVLLVWEYRISLFIWKAFSFVSSATVSTLPVPYHAMDGCRRLPSMTYGICL